MWKARTGISLEWLNNEFNVGGVVEERNKKGRKIIHPGNGKPMTAPYMNTVLLNCHISRRTIVI